MREYRIQAYFKEVYQTRTFKRKVFSSFEEAEKMLPEAVEYYSGERYLGRLKKCVIESRSVGSWEEEKTELKSKTLKELASEYIEKGIETVIEVEWWWKQYKTWRSYFNYPEITLSEEFGNKVELDPEYSFKGSAQEFLEYSEQYECIAEMEGRYCEEFELQWYPDSRGFKGGVVIFAKYVEEVNE